MMMPPKAVKQIIAVADDNVLEYIPNAEIERLWRPVAKWAPYLFLSSILLGWMLFEIGWLNPIIFGLARIFIIPFKGFLMSEPTGAAASVISLLSSASTWVFGITGVGVSIFAMRRAELPNRIAYNPTYLMLTQSQGPDKQYVCKAIPWFNIESVKVERPKSTKSVNDYHIILSNPYGSFDIKYGDIWKPSERDVFLRLLTAHVSPTAFGEKGAEEMFSVFKPAKATENFTELWLRELSAPSKREKLAPLEPGAQLQRGEYTVERKLGTGGQATVYLANHFRAAGNANLVALKEFVMPVFPDARVRKTVAEKFQQEAAMLSRLSHPQIVKLLDVFVEDHRAYLVLERIEGNTLKAVVTRRGQLFEREAAGLGVQMCDILLYLHSQEPPVVHRDFTPDNLMVHNQRLFLIDFSVAQQVEINITGSVVGKHLYMAPEQFRGKTVTQSDIYSLGASLFFLLTGKEPEAISVSHPRALNPDVSEEMDALVAGCTAIDTTVRTSDLQELKNQLTRLAALEQPAQQRGMPSC